MILRRVCVVPVAAAVLCLVLLGSCDNDRATVPHDGDGAPADTTGRIYGHVTGGFGPLAARVEALDANTHRTFSTQTDSSGYYELVLPRANYELFVIQQDGRRTQWMPEGPREGGILAQIRMTWDYHDIPVNPMFGAIHFRIPMTDRCDESPFRIEYHHHNGLGFYIPLRLDAYTTGGFLDVVSDGLLAGKYEIEVMTHGQCFYIPYEPAGERGYVVVETQHLAEWIHEDLPLPARVVGRLTGPWAEVLQAIGVDARPYVSAYRGDGSGFRQVGFARVAIDGRFCLDTLFPDSLVLEVGGERSGDHWMSSSRLEDATVYLPEPGQVLDVGDLPGAALLVRFAREDSQSLGNIVLWLYGEDERPITGSSNSDSIVHPPAGRVGLCHIQPGRYFLLAETFWVDGDYAPEWPRQWYPGVIDFAQAQPIDVSSVGQLTELHWTLKVGGTIRGRLTPSPGSPERTAWVDVYSEPERRRAGGQKVTTSKPDYLVSGLADGAYRVKVAMDGYDWWYPGTRHYDEAAILTIEEQNVVEVGPWLWP